MTDITRRLGESKHQYIKRLTYAKLVEKTLDLDYSELSELIFGVAYAPDETRKRLYGLKYLLEVMEEEKINAIDDTSILNELEMKKIQLQKERIKNSTIKIELNKMLRQDARFELFLEEIKNSIESVKPPVFEEYVCESGERIGVLGISDIHYGKRFASVNNSYSMEICRDRMELLLNETAEWIKDRNISYLHIVNGGDNVEGLLRTNAIRVLEVGVIDSVIEFSTLMAEWLNKVSEYVSLTYHHVISANHSEVRFLNQPAGSFPDEDLEKVIVSLIEGRLRDNDRIKVPIYKTEYAYFNIGDKNIFVAHGHQFRGKKLGVVLRELQMLHGIQIDLMILGHFHHEESETVGENEKGNIKVVMLPAIMGSDTFSDSLLTGSKAGATFVEFNSNKKGLTTTEVVLN